MVVLYSIDVRSKMVCEGFLVGGSGASLHLNY